MFKKIPLHTQIIAGLVLGLIFGLVIVQFGISPDFTVKFIKPIGTIFINALKMIAVPLVLASLIVGVANLGDISKLSRIGGKTIFAYLITTVIAITRLLIPNPSASFTAPLTNNSEPNQSENPPIANNPKILA